MVRQILGAVRQFEKAMLVAKLKGARERKRAATGKCEGRKTYAERSPQMVTLAKRLHRYTIDKRHRSLRDIAAERLHRSRWQETHRSRHLAHDLCVTSGGTRRTGPRLERR